MKIIPFLRKIKALKSKISKLEKEALALYNKINRGFNKKYYEA